MLSDIERTLELRAIELFSNLDDAQLHEVASVVEDVVFASGQLLIEKGDRSETVYLIVSGQIRVFDESTTLATLGPGAVIGELAALDPAPRSASVEALEDVLAFGLSREAFLALLERRFDFAQSIISVLCTRLRSAVVVNDPDPSNAPEQREHRGDVQ